MPFFQPAVRAHQAKRHPALDAHVGRGPLSPGAGSDSHHLYNNNELYPDHSGLTVITPAPTLNAAASSVVGDILTSSTPVGVGVSTSVATQPPTSEGLGSSLSNPAPSSDIILSSSSSPSSSPPMSIPTTTAVTSTSSLQSPASGSTTVPVKGGVISSAPADSALTAEANNPSHHPSGGVIAAIVIVLLLALFAVAFFVFRRYGIQRRAASRVTWTANLTRHPFDASLEKGVDHDPALDSRNEMAGQSSRSSREGGNGQVIPVPPIRLIARKPPLPYSPAISPIPPSPSQSHLSVLDVRAPSTDAASVSISTAPSTPVPDLPALVRMTFVPQLPDELAITPGETVYIRIDYDDGWALCRNSSGKHGMVPLECLEGGGGHFAGRSELRTMRRASSLNSAVTWS